MARSRSTTAAKEAESVDIVDEPQTLVGDNEIETVGGDDYDIDGVLGDDLALPVAPEGEMTTTDNFMGGGMPTIIDEVHEMPTVVQDAAPKKRVVVVGEDVGPVYYGADLIELKKGVKYRVPEHVFRYLNERNLIWSIG